MAEYIKRMSAMVICEKYGQHCFEQNDAHGQHIADSIFDDVVNIPTADVVEVRHGEWAELVRDIGRGRTITKYQCSLCGVYLATEANYCPNCGAKMNGKDDNDG